MKDSILTEEEKGVEYFKREDYKNYFDANPFNTIELDTYIVHPDYRGKGIAKIVTFEGFKIQTKKLIKKRPDLKEIFISATIHRENQPSKRVALSIGKFKALYVKRRIDDEKKKDINREVFFYKIKREDLERTLSDIENSIKYIKDNLNK